MKFLTELRNKNNERQKLWPGSHDASILFRAVEFSGEAGELLNAVKKLYRHDHSVLGNTTDYDSMMQNLREEIGDVLITLDNLAAEYNIDLEEVTKDKFNKTSDKVKIPVKFE